jgi:CRISPR-associated endoribonuclease Cas6
LEEEKKLFMNIDIATTNEAPSRLYALLLRLRPLEHGTLMPFSGELVHGAWLNWIRSYAPEVATWLHDGNRRRLFTCSSLQFPLPVRKLRDAERENIHLPVDPTRPCAIRITLLLGDLFPLFYDSLIQFNSSTDIDTQAPFIKLGKRTFLLEEVLLSNDDPTGWTGFTSFTDLVAAVQGTDQQRQEYFTLEFASLTTFNRSGRTGGEQSNYYARLPLPHYVFLGLARRWQELAPPEMADLVQRDLIEQYIQDEGLVIDDYDLRPHVVRFVNHPQRGFIGTCTYRLRGSALTDTNSPLTVQQQILLLARLAFYTGVGYKPAMGMGQCRFLPGRR